MSKTFNYFILLGVIIILSPVSLFSYRINTTCLADEFGKLIQGDALPLEFSTNDSGEEFVTWASVAGAICDEYKRLHPEIKLLIDNIKLTDTNGRKVELCGRIKYSELQQQGCTFKVFLKCIANNLNKEPVKNKILAQGKRVVPGKKLVQKIKK